MISFEFLIALLIIGVAVMIGGYHQRRFSERIKDLETRVERLYKL
jgi:hypothetical protein